MEKLEECILYTWICLLSQSFCAYFPIEMSTTTWESFFGEPVPFFGRFLQHIQGYPVLLNAQNFTLLSALQLGPTEYAVRVEILGNLRMGSQKGISLGFQNTMTGWWFQTFFIFHNIWDNTSHWLIFFKIVKTTKQMITYFLVIFHPKKDWRFISVYDNQGKFEKVLLCTSNVSKTILKTTQKRIDGLWHGKLDGGLPLLKTHKKCFCFQPPKEKKWSLK